MLTNGVGNETLAWRCALADFCARAVFGSFLDDAMPGMLVLALTKHSATCPLNACLTGDIHFVYI